MDNLTELRKIAEEATPGPWVYGDNRDGLGNKLHPAKFPGKYNPIADFEYTEDEDAEHIATFDPPTVLALLTLLEKAEQVIQRVREALEAEEFDDPHCGDVIQTRHIYRALDGER